MNKKKKPPAKPWDICTDCLDPIYKDFWGELLPRFNANNWPTRYSFEQVLSRHNFPMGLSWLKVEASVELSRELERSIIQPLDALDVLAADANKILKSGKTTLGDSAIVECIKRETESIPTAGLEDGFPGSSIFARYMDLFNSLAAAFMEMERIASVLRGKKSQPIPQEVPSGSAGIVLSLSEAARRLGECKGKDKSGKGRKQIQRYIKSGRLRAVRITPRGNKWRFYDAALLDQ